MISSKLRELTNKLILEGGASGHLMHLYDNRDLTFGELKDILRSAAEGRLQKVTEKLDGMNLVFTWNGELKTARSGSDIKNGGMNASALAKKFHGRENVEEAFNTAFRVLNEALTVLPEKTKHLIFENGKIWYSIEIIYSKNPNVIVYDHNYVVFHANPIFVIQNDGSIEKKDDAKGVEILESYVTKMQAALVQRMWKIRGPALLRLKKLSDKSIINNAISAIEQAQGAGGVDDSGTIGDYLYNIILEEVADLGLGVEAAKAVTARIVGISGAPGLPQIKKLIPVDRYIEVKQFVDQQKTLMYHAIAPIERAIHNFAVEVLRGLHSVLITQHDEEIARLRAQVSSAIKAIESSGDVNAMNILNVQMKKLGNVENIAATMEGIVFIYNGNAYKFTGAFAPANQILGLFKYGRSSAKLIEQFGIF